MLDYLTYAFLIGCVAFGFIVLVCGSISLIKLTKELWEDGDTK